MIDLAILTQNIATGKIFLNWCSHDNTGWWDSTICIVSGFHNNAIAKNRYDNRGLPIQHHLPQARHSGSYIPVLIRMEISHNSATIEEAPKRVKPYSLFTGLGSFLFCQVALYFVFPTTWRSVEFSILYGRLKWNLSTAFVKSVWSYWSTGYNRLCGHIAISFH